MAKTEQNRPIIADAQPKLEILHAEVMLGKNGWVVRFNHGPSMPGEFFIANTPEQIGQVFERHGIKPQHQPMTTIPNYIEGLDVRDIDRLQQITVHWNDPIKPAAKRKQRKRKSSIGYRTDNS